MSRQTGLSPVKLALTGLALIALPVAAVTAQAERLMTGEPFTLPAMITDAQNDSLVPIISVQTPVHTIDLASVSGDNHFALGDTVFVFIKRSGEIWYPYALLKIAPVSSTLPGDTLMLRAKVDSANYTSVNLSYGFDQISPPQRFITALGQRAADPVNITLAASPDGRTSVSAITLGQTKFDQRVTLKSVLFGRKNNSANKAPAM